MFNPQRRAKVVDIYMQEKVYNLHLAKINKINQSCSPRNERYDEESEQESHLKLISKSKKEIKNRMSENLRKENARLNSILFGKDNRINANPEIESERKHHHSFFSAKKEAERIEIENSAMAIRMSQLNSEIPSLTELKKEYKKNRKLAKNCQKLPSIVKYEDGYKKKLSQPVIQSARSFSNKEEL